jgi:hypothetical protein
MMTFHVEGLGFEISQIQFEFFCMPSPSFTSNNFQFGAYLTVYTQKFIYLDLYNWSFMQQHYVAWWAGITTSKKLLPLQGTWLHSVIIYTPMWIFTDMKTPNLIHQSSIKTLNLLTQTFFVCVFIWVLYANKIRKLYSTDSHNDNFHIIQGGFLVCGLGPQLWASQRPMHHLLGGTYEFCQCSMPNCQ